MQDILQIRETTGFIGGNRENEAWYRYYPPDFMYVRISR